MAIYSTFEEIQANRQVSDKKLFHLREEQRDAIDRVKNHYCKRTKIAGEYHYQVLADSRKYLCDAKMRFGKTI